MNSTYTMTMPRRKSRDSQQVAKVLKVTVLGVRGIPNVQGGVETHAEQLYGRLSQMGCDVEVIVRSPFVPRGTSFGPVRLRRLWAPKAKGFEALVHSVLGVCYAVAMRPGILHIHAVGPSIVTPIARLLGLRVVVTHHGPDYDRDKWGKFARTVLRAGESFGMRWSNARIVISRAISELVRTKYQCDSDLIPNGVTAGVIQATSDHVRSFGLQPGRYFLHVGRMVPEKRQLELIAAFAAAAIPGWRLALVGALTEDEYSRSVKAAAAAAGVVLTGFQRGPALEELYTHAGAFVLPSSHEGLPIALLEALSYGLPVLASDIPANLEIGLDESSYFRLDDRDSTVRGLRRLTEIPRDEAALTARRLWTLQTYNWDRVAEQTREVYLRVMAG
jgi:glycosyltransferase involved in cell wall biosynthesis